MFAVKSCMTNCATLKSPALGKGFRLSPCGPPFLATGIIAPGWMRTVCGFKTPSSAARYTPDIAKLAFLSINSFVNTKFKKNKEVLVFKNDEELIKNIYHLKSNKFKADQLSINSQKIIKKKYNVNKVLSKYKKII